MCSARAPATTPPPVLPPAPARPNVAPYSPVGSADIRRHPEADGLFGQRCTP